MPTKKYVIDRSKVVHDTIDGETIIINLDDGSYHSLDLVGGEIWTLIAQGADLSQITLWLSGRYEADTSVIEDALVDFISKLLGQGLVIESSPDEAYNLTGSEKPSSSKPPFQEPNMETFTDMQDFLLVDPIHEVGEEGWPHKRTE